MKPTLLLAALALFACAAFAQDPTHAPAVPPPPQVIYLPAPAPIQAGDTWTWIAVNVLAPISVAVVAAVVAWLRSVEGRVNRQAVKSGQLADQVVDLAKNQPPPPAATPPATPQSSTGTGGSAVAIALAAVLALSGCSTTPEARAELRAISRGAGKAVVNVGSHLLTAWLVSQLPPSRGFAK